MTRLLRGIIIYNLDNHLYIGGCIKSLVGLCDDVLLYSTDGHVWDSRELGVYSTNDDMLRLYSGGAILTYYEKHPIVESDFSAWRNGALGIAFDQSGGIFGSECHYALMIDADERFAGDRVKLRDRLQADIEILDIKDNTAGGYMIRIVNPHVSKDGSVGVIRSDFTRIILNTYTDRFRYINKVHESIAESIFESGYRTAVLDDDIYIAHIGYDIPVDTMEDKNHRNIDLLWEELGDDPENGSGWFHLGKAFGWLHDFDSQKICWDKALKCKIGNGIRAWINEHMLYVDAMAEMFCKE